MTGRLLVGDCVDKDEAKAVSLLEGGVARGDTDAMVMLAKCCALARGMGPQCRTSRGTRAKGCRERKPERVERRKTHWEGFVDVFSQ